MDEAELKALQVSLELAQEKCIGKLIVKIDSKIISQLKDNKKGHPYADELDMIVETYSNALDMSY